MKNLFLTTLFISFLTGCGGGGSSNSFNEEQNEDNDNEGKSLYIGYYVEDAATNPEDPLSGSLYLNLPNEDGDFAGSMFFTYVGCQNSNVGTISGTKSANSLTGSWSGTIDGTAQTGSYTGSFNTNENSYSGDYDVSAGKQLIVVDDCIEYYIAPKGTWYLFPQNVSRTFDGTAPGNCSVVNDVVSWSPPAGYAFSILSFIDKDLAENNDSNATVSQQIFVSETSAPVPASLIQGKTYIASIGAANSNDEILYACNVEFVKQ